MNEEKQIEKERWDIAKIMADNFHINGDGWGESDFEWTAHCVQMAGYRKRSEGEWLGLWDYECSVCHGYSEYKTDFCPNCGAKMKGGEE